MCAEQYLLAPLLCPLLPGKVEEGDTLREAVVMEKSAVGNALPPFLLVDGWLCYRMATLPSPVPSGHVSQGAGVFLMCLRA